jgi:uncharacterized membrane protein
MSRLVNYFIKGLLVFVPAALTIFAVIFVFKTLDGLFGIPIPGLGVVLTILLILLIGVAASNFLGAKFFGLLDKLLIKLPIVKMVYSAAKDFTEAFAGEKKGFDKPVVVEMVKNGPRALGFITREDLDFLSLPGHCAVYFPQSYNFAGSVLIFPNEQITRLDLNSSEVMTFIVSGGVSGKCKNNDKLSEHINPQSD